MAIINLNYSSRYGHYSHRRDSVTGQPYLTAQSESAVAQSLRDYQQALQETKDTTDREGKQNHLKFDKNTGQLTYEMPADLEENKFPEDLPVTVGVPRAYQKFTLKENFYEDDEEIDPQMRLEIELGDVVIDYAPPTSEKGFGPAEDIGGATRRDTIYNDSVDITPILDGNSAYEYTSVKNKVDQWVREVDGGRFYYEDDDDGPQISGTDHIRGGGNSVFEQTRASRKNLYKMDDWLRDYSRGRLKENTVKGQLEIARTNARIANNYNGEKNKAAAALNDASRQYNQNNALKKQAYDKAIEITNQTRGGDYTDRRAEIRNLSNVLTEAGLKDTYARQVTADIEDQFKDFYRSEKLETYDRELHGDKAKPPTGEFDPIFYRGQKQQPNGLTEQQKWQDAVADDNLDIIERYGISGNQAMPVSLNDSQALNYIASHNDLINTFGGTNIDIEGAKDHWLQYGKKEKRRFNFDAKKYLEENDDLKRAFGDDEDKALTHYIQYGRDEVAAKKRKKPPTITPSLSDAEEGYYLMEYVNQRGPGELRGNAAKKTDVADEYLEEAPTDTEMQFLRDKMLEIEEDDPLKLVNSVEYVKEAWEEAKKQKDIEGTDNRFVLKAGNFFNIDNPDEFLLVFQQSEDPTDIENYKELLKYSNDGNYITDLEDVITETVGTETLLQTKKFGALTQKVLKDTINEIKKAKRKEQDLALMNDMGSLSEIMNVNSSLADSLLGDTGIGGYLAFLPKGSGFDKQSLEEKLSGVTGVGNNVTYNWQKWFDDTLTKNLTDFEEDYLELGYTRGEAEDAATEQVNIQKEFAEKYVKNYLQPRFDQSKSMHEFMEYIDVKEEEQNPFQTQTVLNAVRLAGDTAAGDYLKMIKDASVDKKFNTDFYFNPTGAGKDLALEARYAKQKQTVSDDWDTARNKPNTLIDPSNPSAGTWAQRIYEFGTDVTKQDQFARLHYQVKGQFNKDENGDSRPFDAAEDVVNAGQVQAYIDREIVPKLSDAMLDNARENGIFGKFTLPEEYADEMLEGLDPNVPESWQKVLTDSDGNSLIGDFEGSFQELKDYLTESFRGGSAANIRANIKYLNERREKPTQEKLGITYIQREEDYKTDSKFKGDTELFKAFQDAGYDGSEEDFYKDVFPDMDPDEQLFISDITSKGIGKTFGLDKNTFSDPYASLDAITSFDSTISNLFTGKENKKDDDDEDEEGYFSFGPSKLSYDDKKKGNAFLKGYVPSFKKDNPIFDGFF